MLRSTALTVLALGSALAATATRATVDRIEGDVRLDGTPLTSIPAAISPGQALKTGEGMTEIALSSGVFLRLGNDSQLTFQTQSTGGIEAGLSKGEAIIEVLSSAHPKPVFLSENGTVAEVQKPGLYAFNRDRSTVAVYSGSVDLTKDEKQILLQAGFGVKTRNLREFPVNPDPSDSLSTWSNLRSLEIRLESAAATQHFNYIPLYPGGDSYLYGPPVPESTPVPAPPAPGSAWPAVPLTAPGVPSFPNSRLGRR